MDTNEQELSRLQAAYDAAPGSRSFAPLADAYRRAGRLVDAVQLLEAGTSAHPEYVAALVLLGQSYVENADDAAAAATFERVLAQDPENLVALKDRAQRALRRRDWDQVENLLALVLEIDPFDQEAQKMRESTSRLRAVATASPPAEEERAEPPVAQAPAPPAPRPVPEVSRPPAHREAARAPAPTPEAAPGDAPGAPAPQAADWQIQRDDDRIVVRPSGASDLRHMQTGTPSDEFSTLTVARIYESQGYLDRALAIYEALQRRSPKDAEVQERIAALKQRLTHAPAPARSDAEAAPTWRLLDPQSLAAVPQQTAADLRDLAGAVRESQQGQRHTVVGTPPRAPQAPQAPADEPDYERFLRYVRSLKRGG